MPIVVLSLCLKPLSIASLNLCCVTHESMEGNITLGPSYLTNGDADDFHVLCSLSGIWVLAKLESNLREFWP